MNLDQAITLPRRQSGRSLFRNAVEARLALLDHGLLEIERGGHTSVFGAEREGELVARITIQDDRFYQRLALGGTLGAAESYLEGEWNSRDLTGLVRLILRNASALGALESGMARYGATLARLWGGLRRNTRAGSRKNIESHYDIGNDFFERMLDPTLSYSAAIFPRPDATLEEASRHKLELLCQKLELGPSDHLLELGTGWGSLALHAAGRFGARVTTTTLSQQQRLLALERVRSAGLDRQVQVLERDYRDLNGSFDKLVSVEMIEAVGAEYYDTYFRKCGALLKPGGLMALQSITIADHLYERHRREVDFIKRYIFPGSNIPSVAALSASMARSSELCLRGLEDYGLHYARTLAAWRAQLEPHEAWVVARYGRRFYRSWMFYLAYCEAGFSEGYISVVQMLFERPRWRWS